MSKVQEFIVDYLQREYDLPDGVDLDTFDFVETGYVDSMGMVQFIVLLEDEFGIAFTDEELAGQEFRTVGGLTRTVERKMEEAANG